MSRAWTEEEIREQFLDHVRNTIDYWKTVDLDLKVFPNEDELTRRMNGLAFSILTALDGEAMAVPGFKVIPNSHPDDKQYYIDNGENWYPDDIDIGGCLHEELDIHKS